MRIRKIKDQKQLITLSVIFILFFLSYSFNTWHISTSNFYTFERSPEGLVIGKMARSQKDGVFAYGGLTGSNLIELPSGDLAEELEVSLAAQHDIYLKNKDLPEKYIPYKSQSGGHAILYSIIQSIVPGSNYFKLKVIKTLNALLTALCIVLFIGWVYRNNGFGCSIITGTLLLLSPWLNNFSHNLWWSFWNFYVPFLSALLLLEYYYNNPKKYSFWGLGLVFFFAILIKCIFSGFEYITTILLSAICPLVYYAIYDNKSAIDFIKTSFLAGLSMIVAIITAIVILILQIASVSGSINDGIQHILYSFIKRSTISESMAHESLIGNTLSDIFFKYLGGNAFGLGFLPSSFKITFGLLILIIFICSIITYLLDKKETNKAKKTNNTLIITTFFSLICPFSWLIIFKQHAAAHPHIDYIIWYIPFLLYGFVIIGNAFTIIFKKLSSHKSDKAI